MQNVRIPSSRSAQWFRARVRNAQANRSERGWPAIQSGAHALIAAPTGSGKTLAAFLASLDPVVRRRPRGRACRDETQILYVSPLKALSNDIHKNLREQPLAAIREALLQPKAAMWISAQKCGPAIHRRRSDSRSSASRRTFW